MRASRTSIQVARWARFAAAVGALALVAGLVQVAPAAAATGSAISFDRGVKVPGHAAGAVASTAKSLKSAPVTSTSLPRASTTTVSLTAGGAQGPVKTRGSKGSRAATVAGGWQSAGNTGLSLAAATAAGKTAKQSRVTVSVLSAADAKKHHLSGLVVKLSRTGGDTSANPVAVQVPDSLLAGLYGAYYSGRLRWVQVPDSSATMTQAP